MNKEHPEIQSLKTSINGLIADYEQAYALLQEQMQAVVKHDILSLNELVEKQVATYETLKQSELRFKEHIQTFHEGFSSNGNTSLGNVLKSLDEPNEMLNNLRTRLHSQVEKTEKLRLQVMDLLQFAQQQNAHMFESICTFASDASDAYDSKGKKMNRQASGLAINQQV